MTRRLLLALLVTVGSLSMGAAAPAPRTIRVVMTSFKFEPNLISLRQGERVVLELVNQDTQRPHNLASELLNYTQPTVRGEFREGTTSDGRRFVFVKRASAPRWSSPCPNWPVARRASSAAWASTPPRG